MGGFLAVLQVKMCGTEHSLYNRLLLARIADSGQAWPKKSSTTLGLIGRLKGRLRQPVQWPLPLSRQLHPGRPRNSSRANPSRGPEFA
jgi:hypothetical protein